MNTEQVAQITADVTTWMNIRRDDIPATTRQAMAQKIGDVAARSNWVKVCDETDLGSVGDEYSEQLDLIQQDIERVNPSFPPMLTEVLSSVIGMAGWRHHA